MSERQGRAAEGGSSREKEMQSGRQGRGRSGARILNVEGRGGGGTAERQW